MEQSNNEQTPLMNLIAEELKKIKVIYTLSNELSDRSSQFKNEKPRQMQYAG